MRFYKGDNVIKIKLKYKILLSILILLPCLILAIFYLYIGVPQKDKIETSSIPDTYFISNGNSELKFQSHFECAAFSSSYVMRLMGHSVYADDIYPSFSGKLPNGTIAPKGIVTYFAQNDYTAIFLDGDVNSLKAQLSSGNYVIALIRVFPNKPYLHYIPITGYDDEYLYIAESLDHFTNCESTYYNRKVPINEFETLWKTGIPFYNNCYFVIPPKIQ